jgi:hypothetical protein
MYINSHIETFSPLQIHTLQKQNKFLYKENLEKSRSLVEAQ